MSYPVFDQCISNWYNRNMKKGGTLPEETRRKISETKRKQKIVTPTSFKKGDVPWNKGKPSPWVTERNKKNNPTKRGEEHWNWHGESVKYRGLHRWVVKQLGQPSECVHCGKKNLFGHSIHWANISRTYQRDINDWIRLCAKCHKGMDRKTK
jgi:hypothetical protein